MGDLKVKMDSNFDEFARKLGQFADKLPSELERTLEPFFQSVVSDAKNSSDFNDVTGKLRSGYQKKKEQKGKDERITKFSSKAPYWVYIEYGTKNIKEREVISRALAENQKKLQQILVKYFTG